MSFGRKSSKHGQANVPVTSDVQENLKSDVSVAKTEKKKKGGMHELFDETVLEQVLDDFSSNTPFIVERNGETQYVGILIKAADMGGLDRKTSKRDTDKGQLVQQLNSGAIPAYFTQQLLQDEEIVIIPNSQAMANVDEFSIVKNAPWFYVYVNREGDIERTDVLTGFDDVSCILKGDYPITDRLGGRAYGSNSEEPEENVDMNSDEIADDFDDSDEPVYDEYASDEAPVYEEEEYYDDSEREELPDDYYEGSATPIDMDSSEYDASGSESLDGDFSEPTYEEEIPEDVSGPNEDTVITSKQVEMAIVRKFYSDELGLEVSTEPFDSQFVHGNTIALFNTDRPEGWLNNYLNEVSRNANIELTRLHNSNIYKMREYYLEAMSKHCEAIQKELDVLDASTLYGQQADIIRKDMLSDKSQIDDKISVRKLELSQEWEAKLNEVAEQAAIDAKSRYRDRYGRQYEQDVLQIGPTVRDEIEMNYQMNLRDMNQRRKNEALKRLDYSINETLSEVSHMYLDLLKEEEKRHTELEEQITAYLDENRKDDVARSEALAEELRQSQKADRVTAEFTEKIKNLNAEFDSKRVSMQAELEQMQRENELALQAKENDWLKRYKESEDMRATQRDEINDLLNKFSSLDEQKNREFASRINEIKNEKASLEDKCDHIIAVNRRSHTVVIFLTVISVVASLAIGFIAGTFVDLKSVKDNTNAAIVEEYQQRLDDLETQKESSNNKTTTVNIVEDTEDDTEKVTEDSTKTLSK